MPISPSEILKKLLGDVSLSVLLFGPSLQRLSNDPDERSLQDKRSDIYRALTQAGHHVVLAEDIVEPGFPTALPYSVMTREYDVIISYVSSSTASTEIEIISSDPEIADKSKIFVDSRELQTVMGGMCDGARQVGAKVEDYLFPDDIQQCNLLTASLRYVIDSQAKHLAI